MYIPRCGLNHGRGLHIRQFLDAALTCHNVAHFQGQVGVLVLLANLQARKVRIPQFHFVLVQEVFRHRAFHGLTVVQLQWKTEKRLLIYHDLI